MSDILNQQASLARMNLSSTTGAQLNRAMSVNNAELRSDSDRTSRRTASVEEFSGLSQLLETVSQRKETCVRTKLRFSSNKVNKFSIPWPNKLNSLIYNFYRLEAVFIVFTPLISSVKTNMKFSIVDERVGSSADEYAVLTSVSFSTDKLVLFGMGLGNSIASRDASRIKIAAAIEDQIVKVGTEFATADCYFVTTKSNKACLTTNSVVGPMYIPAAEKNLLSSFSDVIKKLKASNTETSKALSKKDEIQEFFGRNSVSTMESSTSTCANLSEILVETSGTSGVHTTRT